MPPSRDHEVPLVLLSEHEVAAWALFREAAPEAEGATLEAADPTTSIELVRTRMPDRVWLLRDRTRAVVRVFLVEFERAWQEGKALSWGASVGALQGQHGCPATLVVVSGSRAVLRRARASVRFGDLVVLPRVVTTADLAALALRLEDADAGCTLAVAALRMDQDMLTVRLVRRLSAAHLRRPPASRALRVAFADALAACAERYSAATFMKEAERIMLDLSMLEDGSIMASQRGKALLREYADKIRKEGEARGERRGERRGLQRGEQLGAERGALATAREAVLAAMEARFGELPEGARAAVLVCTDREALKASLGPIVRGEALEAVVARLR